MKRMITKKTMMALLAVVLLAAFLMPNLILAGPDIKIVINGQEISFPDQKPYIDSANRTMVPVRAPMEAIGCTVEWDADKQQAIISKQDTVAVFTIGSKTYTVNGVEKTMDTKAVIAGNRTAFPIRFAAEAMGATVGWDAATYTVMINTEPTPTGIIIATPEQVAAIKEPWDEQWWATNYRIGPSVTRSFDAMTQEEKDIAWGLLETGIIKPGQTFIASKDTTCVMFTGVYVVRGYLTIESGKTYLGSVSGAYEDGEYVRVIFNSDEFVGETPNAVPVHEQRP